MLIGIDATCWNNKRGYGRFTRGVLGALVESDRANQYYFFTDRQTLEQASFPFPAPAKIITVETKIAPSQAASASGRRSIGDLWQISRQVSAQRLEVFFFPSVYTYFPLFNRTRQVFTIH